MNSISSELNIKNDDDQVLKDQIEIRIPTRTKDMIKKNYSKDESDQTYYNNINEEEDEEELMIIESLKTINECLKFKSDNQLLEIDSDRIIKSLKSFEGYEPAWKKKKRKLSILLNDEDDDDDDGFNDRDEEGGDREVFNDDCQENEEVVMEEDDDTPSILLLGQGALENCVPPPYRTPRFYKNQESFLKIRKRKLSEREDSEERSKGEESSSDLKNESRRNVLERLKPWPKFEPLTNQSKNRPIELFERKNQGSKIIEEEEEYDLSKYSNRSSKKLKNLRGDQGLSRNILFETSLLDKEKYHHHRSRNRRGFWLIPIWKWPIRQNDFYSTFGHLISLPQWTTSEEDLSQSKVIKGSEGFEKDYDQSSSDNPHNEFPSPLSWNPLRLRTFWECLSKICERQKLGKVMAHAVVSNHDDMIEEVEEGEGEESVKIEKEDNLGDHIRIWTTLENSMILRRFISDINLSSTLKNHNNKNKKNSKQKNINISNNYRGINYDEGLKVFERRSFDLKEDYEGKIKFKWLKDCKFMWFDESGLPRGYS